MSSKTIEQTGLRGALAKRDLLAKRLSAARSIGDDGLAAKLEYVVAELDGLLAFALLSHTRH